MEDVNPTAPPAEAVGDADLPRFIVAVQQCETFWGAKAGTLQGSAAQRTKRLHELMAPCDDLRRLSQDLEFAQTTPNLADTQAPAVIAQQLAAALAEPGIPPEVKAIYEGLYGADLQPYAAPDGM